MKDIHPVLVGLIGASLINCAVALWAICDELRSIRRAIGQTHTIQVKP